MTDRVNGFWVALDQDIREDDVEAISNAILMMKHVIGVKNNLASPDEWIARTRMQHELRWKILDLLKQGT